MQPSISADEHISNACEGTKRVCSARDFRCCQGALTFVHVVVHFLIWTFPNERHAISAIALPRLYVAAHMRLDPLHGLSMSIRNRAVVIYRDDQSCTHPGPSCLTDRVERPDREAGILVRSNPRFGGFLTGPWHHNRARQQARPRQGLLPPLLNDPVAAGFYSVRLQRFQGKLIGRKEALWIKLPLDSSQSFVLFLAVIEVGPHFLQHPLTKGVGKQPHIRISISLPPDEYLVVLPLPLLRLLVFVAAEPVYRIK